MKSCVLIPAEGQPQSHQMVCQRKGSCRAQSSREFPGQEERSKYLSRVGWSTQTYNDPVQDFLDILMCVTTLSGSMQHLDGLHAHQEEKD